MRQSEISLARIATAARFPVIAGMQGLIVYVGRLDLLKTPQGITTAIPDAQRRSNPALQPDLPRSSCLRTGDQLRRNSVRGNAVIEFALAFSLLWAALAGVFQFGYAMYIYNELATATAQGARFASTVDFDSLSQNFAIQVKNMVVYGSPVAGASPLVQGLTTANVSVSWSVDASGVPENMTVSIVNYTCDAIFRSFTWNGKPLVTVRYMGVYKT